MKRLYKITMRTSDIFNFTTCTIIKQYDMMPEFTQFYNSKDGQLADIQVKCTRNEKFVLSMALGDYILRMVEVNSQNEELSLFEKFLRRIIW